jgi:predicted nucleotidyltransferase component of viral defense system
MNRLRKRTHRDIALLEDVIVRIIYGIDNTAEIHGGTAIWRCYNGRRFSKDIDVYIASQEKWQEFKEKIADIARDYNAEVVKLKDTGNLIFIDLLMDGIYSEIDINYKSYYKEPMIRQYENLDGTFFEVLTLPPQVLILEKISAYNDRKSITDLYDISILVDYVDIEKVKRQLSAFIRSIEKPEELGEEEERLKDLIFEGPVPSFKSIVSYIEGKIQ